MNPPPKLTRPDSRPLHGGKEMIRPLGCLGTEKAESRKVRLCSGRQKGTDVSLVLMAFLG